MNCNCMGKFVRNQNKNCNVIINVHDILKNKKNIHKNPAKIV